MHAKLVLIVGSLQIISILSAELRFEKVDKLEEASKDLQFAFIIFRHGIRAPINNIYGSDEEFAKMWPDEKGGLTEDGKRLMVHVGQSLRTRYRNLVPDYNQEQVQVTSTSVARTTMSANAVAAGMFPPLETIIEDNPSWQPIPVFHNQVPDKSFLFDEVFEKATCPRYTKIKDSVIREEMTKLSKSQKNDLEKINKILEFYSSSPIKTKPINSLDDLFDVWDAYFMEDLSKKAVQPWAKKIMPAMFRLAQFRLWSRMHGKIDGQSSILQYYTGPLLNQILTEMIQQYTNCLYSQMSGGTPGTRLHLHGSHDLSVGVLVWALVDQRTFMALPGDTLILEADRHARVKLLLYSPLRSGKKLRELSLKGLCNQKTCTFEQLIKGLKQLGLSYSEDDWKQKCSNLEGAESATWRETSSSYMQNIYKLMSLGRNTN